MRGVGGNASIIDYTGWSEARCPAVVVSITSGRQGETAYNTYLLLVTGKKAAPKLQIETMSSSNLGPKQVTCRCPELQKKDLGPARQHFPAFP